MTLQQVYDTSVDDVFRKRVKASVLQAAESIVGEDWSGQGFSKTKADKRHAVGVKILNGDGNLMIAFANAVAANIGEVDDPSTLTDNQIDSAVSSIWDDIAGVMYGE